MTRVAAIVVCVGLAIAAPAAEGTKSVTWTGYFTDANCGKVLDGKVRPNNTECVKRCLSEGVKAVFASEQAKALFEVRDYPSVNEDLGYHVELSGTVDEEAGTISVKSVKRLSEVVNLCAVPKKK